MRGTTMDDQMEHDMRNLLAPLQSAVPTAEGALRARAALVGAATRPMPQRRRFFARRMFVAAGVGLPLLAVSAVGALTDQGNLGAPIALLASAGADVAASVQSIATVNSDPASGSASLEAKTEAQAEAAVEAHADGHGCDDVNPAVVAGAPAPGGPADCVVGNSGDHRQNGAAATASAGGGLGAGSQASADAHANGHGCDDVNPAVLTGTPAPGGPVGCSVGNSGDHRKNGAAADANAGVDAGPGVQVGAGVGAGAGASAEAHANGLGCDDVNPAVIDGTPSHGGPVGCTAGNSGDHRQNGQNGAGGGSPDGAATEPADASTGAQQQPPGKALGKKP